jgi:hypothetical protein
MLITKELEIRITGNVVNYYRNHNIDIKVNQINKLPIHLVNPQSHLKVDAKCDICNKEVKIQYRRYNQSISRGGYYTCSVKCAKQKIKNIFKEKYGEEIPFKTENFKEKTQQTNLKKWGKSHFRQSDKWKNINESNEVLKRKKTQFSNFLLDNPKVIDENSENFIIECEIHGNVEIPKNLYSNRKIKKTELCVECCPINSNVSGKEILLSKLISELYDGEIINSYKINRKEIDIYLPDLKIGFEFNGLRWHSEQFVDKKYHMNKTKLCNDNDIRLIHVFEDDFDYKYDIIRSIINNILGKSYKIYGRNTEIKKITDKSVVKSFLNENHLQGFVNSNFNYGLYHNDDLVSIMTFMKTRKIFNNKEDYNSYELIRFCNKLNHTIIGGASKLFNAFISEVSPKKILSYCDISWANGDLYYKLGMNYVGITQPNYYYIVNGKRENRIKYQKHKLVKEGYNKNLTEKEIMNERDLYRIYNCGNKIFELKFQGGIKEFK